MMILNRIKKIGVLVVISLVVSLLFITSPYVYAGEPISTEVVDSHYENDDIYYSDSYFAHSSTEYDSHLATLSILMAKFSMNPGNPSGYFDNDWYLNQSNRVKGFFEKIGFNDFLPNDDYKAKTTFDTIGVGIARKKVGDYTVLAIAVRSGGYFREWSNNIWLGDGTKSDYMHEGWYNAANKLLSHLRKYIDKYVIDGKIKLWMAGYSRGGAVTNLAAGLIDNNLNNTNFISNKITLAHDDIYAYTFEAPQGANINSKNVKYPKDALYNNIFNIVNPNDLVTKVAMSKYGFTRFGIDKFITTKFYDPENFDANRSVFKKLYSESNKDVDKIFPDRFIMKGITGDKIAGILAGGIALGPIGLGLAGYLTEKIAGIVTNDNTKANYDSNIVSTMVIDQLTSEIGNRDAYCRIYQTLLRDVLYAVMADNKLDEAISIEILVQTILMQTMIKKFGLSADLIKTVYKDFSDISMLNVSLLATVLIKTYTERPNEIISLITNISDVFKNHDTDVNVAHIKSQDSYYIKAYNDKHPSDQINAISLRENADIVHIAFYGYNSVTVDKGNTNVVNVDGHVFGKSDVKKCDPHYAVGYYSYITEEKMELYLPINTALKVSFKSYSKKLRHLVKYDTYCQYITSQNNNSKNNGNSKLPSGSDHAWFNSDRKTISINVTA